MLTKNNFFLFSKLYLFYDFKYFINILNFSNLYYNYIIINKISVLKFNNLNNLNIFINVKNNQGFLKKNKFKIKSILNKKSTFFFQLSKLKKLKFFWKKKILNKNFIFANKTLLVNKKSLNLKTKKFNFKYLDFRKKYLSVILFNRKSNYFSNHNNTYQTSFKITKKINKIKLNKNIYSTFMYSEFFLPFFLRNLNFLVFFKDYARLSSQNYFLINFKIINKNTQTLKLFDLISINASSKYLNYLNFFLFLKKKSNFYKAKYKFKKSKKKKATLNYDIFYSKLFILKNGFIRIPSYIEINYFYFIACLVKEPNLVSVFKNPIFKHISFYVFKQLNWYHI